MEDIHEASSFLGWVIYSYKQSYPTILNCYIYTSFTELFCTLKMARHIKVNKNGH